MPKTTSRKTKSPTTKSHSGKKGGIGVLTPETIGAMTGAAIGGVAGMMLGNHHHKSKIAIVKEGAAKANESATKVLEAQMRNSSGKKNTHDK